MLYFHHLLSILYLLFLLLHLLAETITINNKINSLYIGSNKILTAAINEEAEIKDIEWTTLVSIILSINSTTFSLYSSMFIVTLSDLLLPSVVFAVIVAFPFAFAIT